MGKRFEPMILAAALAYGAEASPPIPLAWREGQLCVEVKMPDDRPAWFLLDTGARESVLGARAYARLVGAGAAPAEDGTLAVAGARLGDFPLPPLRFSRDELPAEGGAEGRLGMDLLARYRVGLDLREKTLRL